LPWLLLWHKSIHLIQDLLEVPVMLRGERHLQLHPRLTDFTFFARKWLEIEDGTSEEDFHEFVQT
jgi:hypothetical protein